MENDLNFDNNAQQAEELYQKGLKWKALGQADTALTEFRRAVIANPNHGAALFETGMLLKNKAASDPSFWPRAFENLQKAARMDISNQALHQAYITAGQKMNRLDELLIEYGQWEKENPSNEFIIQCRKNILTISMSMIPDPGQSHNTSDSVRLKKFLLMGSLGLMFFGLVFLIGPLIFNKGMKKHLTAEQVRNFFRVGGVLVVLGAGGLIGRPFIK